MALSTAHLLLLLAGLTSPSSAQSRSTKRICYFPDGKESPDYACDEGADQSPCCGVPPYGNACLSNGLCQFGDAGSFSRGSCTDPTWLSPECPSFCATNGDQPSRGINVIQCNNGTGPDSFCCEIDGSDCCAAQGNRLNLGPSHFVWATFVASPTPRYTVVRPLSSSTSSPSTSHGTPTASPSASGTPTAPGEAQPTQTPGSTSGSSGLSTGARAGIGVGVAAGAVLIAVVAYLFWRMHRKNKMMEEALNNQQWAAPPPPPPPPVVYSPGGSGAIPAEQDPKYPMGSPPPPQAYAELPHQQQEHAELPAWQG